jgi:serine/threonine protein phosphatase 1
MRILAISDVHGCAKTLDALLDQVGLTKSDQLFFLGDFIDRGPSSKAVLDILFKLSEDGYNIELLRGNHEQMMFEAPQSFEKSQIWLRNGGREVMEEFNALNFTDIADKYYNLIERMHYYLESEEFIFVHAGFNLNTDNPFEDKKSMLWIRKWEEQDYLPFIQKRTVIHGHTPQTADKIIKRMEELNQYQVLNIDNGCSYTFEGMGQLCCVDLSNLNLYFQKNIDI